MEKENCILQVALQRPLRQTFDYLLPVNYQDENLQVGLRVRVPFGKREDIGIIMNINQSSLLPKNKLKNALEILDSEPLFTSHILSLYDFASQYYQHPIGDVIFSSLPPLFRDGIPAILPEETVFTLTEIGATANEATLKHAVQQQKLIELLKERPNGLSREEITEPGQIKALTALLAKGFIRKQTRKKQPAPQQKSVAKFILNEHQTNAVTTILNHKGFETFLLEGVTGSGKTEVYLQCIEQVLKQNKQTLILVPEIGLTPQTVARFQSRFAVPISILHSGLSDKDRCNAWLSAHKGISRIIIGTRSAILTPLPQLGMIILDEEHDASFKQQSGFRYSAKDLAIMRGKLEDIPVILGSATPCLESLYNVKQKRFKHLMLPKRAGNAVEPAFHIIDVRNAKLAEGFSPLILEKMSEHLKKSGQILIFLNRRGYAPTLLCHGCGWIADCKRCDARLTYHAHLEKMICHHCTTEQPVIRNCQNCHSKDLLLLGLGTQKLEKVLQDRFPDTTITRIDRDSTRRKGSMEKMLTNAHNGTTQILIGTQMLAKGHHFPDVTMVAIIDIDNSLFSADFRASERLGQIIVQVAGRAGRSDKPGEVYLQTHNPDHPLLSLLTKTGYANFANSLLAERASAQLPPYSHLVLFRAEATNAQLPQDFLSEVRQLLLAANEELQVFGPIPALMEKKAGKFRAQLLIQTTQRSNLQKLLQPKIIEIDALPSSSKVRWSIDVDPLEVF